MTLDEIRKALTDFENEVGPRCEISLSVSSLKRRFGNGQALYAGIYPEGVGRNLAVGVWGGDWAELFANIRAEWDKRKAEHRAKTVRKMALEIIRLTAEFGECTDAALRGEFSPEDVEFYGAEAVKDADEIAGNGPFAITLMPQSNAA